MSLADSFIGQTTAVNQIQIACDVAKTKGSIMPHILLLSGPGLGKTKLAGDIAWEMDAPLASISMPSPPEELMNLMLLHRGILLIDEIHMMERKVFDALLPFLTTGKMRYRKVPIENQRLTIVAATTDPQKIPDAFRSRFRLVPPFVDYSIEEIDEILRARHLDIDPDISRGLAEASLWNPRQAIQLLDTYKDLCTVRDGVTARDVLDHLGFKANGLRPDHLRYLEALQRQGMRASMQTLAQMVFMPASSLYWVERDLLRLGFISISSAGRELRSVEWDADVQSEAISASSDINAYTLEPRT